jgi:hypothetical protein
MGDHAAISKCGKGDRMIYLNNFFKHLIVISVFLILVFGTRLQGDPLLSAEISNLEALLSDLSTGNWVKTDEIFYNRETLYDYINGGAELYLSYGFQDLITQIYQMGGQPDIVIDLFDMETSDNAFGVFSHSREKLSDEFGQGSQYTAGLMLFWKDRYYISILASPETPESKKTVYDLARQIDARIGKKGKLPELLHRLPTEHLVDISVRYFKHHIWQNSYYFITEENIFHIGEQTDAVLAKYQDLGILILIVYPSEVDAENALQNFNHIFLPEYPVGGIMQIEDKSWTSAQVSGRLIKAVFNAPSKSAVQTLIDAVQ